MKQPFEIKPYLDYQIDNEERYYKELQPYIMGLVLVLLQSIDAKITNFVTLDAVVDRYLLQNSAKISQINRVQAGRIVATSNLALSNMPAYQPYNTNAATVSNLHKQLDVLTKYLISETAARVFNLVPLGALAGLVVNFFTDETSKDDLFRRTNSSVMGFVRDCYSQATVNTMLGILAKNGYTEYRANNQHDDKVRPLHKKYFEPSNWIRFDNPPPCGNVCTQANCRCYIVEVR